MNKLNSRYLFVIGILIIASIFIVEFYVNQTHPLIDYTPSTIRDLVPGSSSVYNYFKDGALIGNYTFIVEEKGTTAGAIYYRLYSETKVVFNEALQVVRSRLTVSEAGTPLRYSLNATIDNTLSSTVCIFASDRVKITATYKNETNVFESTLPKYSVIIDNSNPGHWELLSKSLTLKQGQRYRVNIFVPQTASVTAEEVSIDSKTQFTQVGGVDYECVVVRQPDSDISVYLNEGDMLLWKDLAKDIEIVKRRR